MAVFPQRPDLHTEQDTRDYVRYMVERLEYTLSQLHKEIEAIKEETDNA